MQRLLHSMFYFRSLMIKCSFVHKNMWFPVIPISKIFQIKWKHYPNPPIFNDSITNSLDMPFFFQHPQTLTISADSTHSSQQLHQKSATNQPFCFHFSHSVSNLLFSSSLKIPKKSSSTANLQLEVGGADKDEACSDFVYKEHQVRVSGTSEHPRT